MRSLRAYLPLVLRPGVLALDVFVVGAMALGVAFLGAAFAAAVERGTGPFPSPEVASALALLVAPAALGVVALHAPLDLCCAHFTWSVRDVRARLVGPIAVLAALGAAGGAAWSGALGSDAGLATRLALAYLAFAAGGASADPVPPRRLARASALGVVGAALVAAPLVRGADALALLAVPAALAAGTALLARLLGAPRHRRALVAATWDLGLEWRETTAAGACRLADSDEAFRRRPDAGTASWVRAALYESTGGATASRWLAQALVLPTVLAAACLAGSFLDGLEAGDARTGLAYAAAAFFRTSPDVTSSNGPPDHLVALVLAMGVTFAALARVELHGVALYPLSRRARAALASRTALLQGAVTLAVFGAPFALAAEGLAAATGVPRGDDLVPWYARAVLLAVLVLPLLLGARDRFAAWMARGQLRTAAFLTPAFVGATVLVQAGDAGWRELEEVGGPAAALAAWALAAAAGQLLLRAWYGRSWARRDLA